MGQSEMAEPSHPHGAEGGTPGPCPLMPHNWKLIAIPLRRHCLHLGPEPDEPLALMVDSQEIGGLGEISMTPQ